MFIKYQTVRNAIIGTAIVGGVATFFALRGGDKSQTTPSPPNRGVAVAKQEIEVPPSTAPIAAESAEVELPGSNSLTSSSSTSTATKSPRDTVPARRQPRTDQQRYAAAMRIATSTAEPSAKGKDVLGPRSPWKLNLYDDNQDGQWDRAKLDRNRDEVDDEKWNFKEGRWEKDGGALVWLRDRWSPDPKKATNAVTARDRTNAGKQSSDPTVTRYQAAMKIATSRADPSGKGKDVLGPRSPWKLNLYDDNQDGQWDRAKLDTNRDEVDDEKWNFKKGRWEKDGGASIWNGKNWIPSK